MIECLAIYLAAPFSHPDEAVRRDRANRAAKFAAAMMADDPMFMIYSPISYGQMLLDTGYTLPTDAAHWKAFNDTFLRNCDEMWLLKLDGWEESAGIADEIATCKKLEIPRLTWAGDYLPGDANEDL